MLAAAGDGGWVIGWREAVEIDLGERLQFQAFDASGRPTSGRITAVGEDTDQALDIWGTGESAAATYDLLRLAEGDIVLGWEIGGDVFYQHFTVQPYSDLSLANLIQGGDAAEDLFGGAGDDTIHGGGGDDTLDGGIGADCLIGGAGSNLFHVDDAGDRVSESRSWAGTDTVISSVDFRTGNRHIENVTLTGDAVVGAGKGLRNTIIGTDGDNILDGGKNVDTLIRGLGNDIYLLRAPGDNAVETADGGIDTVRSFGSFRLDAHVEKLFMQTVRAKDGSPTQFNGIGNDLDNTIIGTPFENTLVGREGADTLKGQAGADTFVFDRAIGDDNIDRIVDFNANEADEGDRLLLKGSLFDGIAAGVLDPEDFVAETTALEASDRFIFDQASGQLWFSPDVQEIGDQVLIATFEQNALVTAADIEIF